MEKKQCELGSLSSNAFNEIKGFILRTSSSLSSLPSDPLFSVIVALYSLILLYFPQKFLNLVFSPVLISTGILLSIILRLGENENELKQTDSREAVEIDTPNEDHKCTNRQADTETETEMGFYPKPFYSDSFIEWNVRAPLEIIYEEYEGEEEDDDSNEKEEKRQLGIERMCSLSLYFPESDTDSSSTGDFPEMYGWDSPEDTCFRWDEEDREGLIEIQLDVKRSSMFHVEEENLIEIEISPARNI